MIKLIPIAVAACAVILISTNCGFLGPSSDAEEPVFSQEEVAAEEEAAQVLPNVKPVIQVITGNPKAQFRAQIQRGAEDAAQKYDIILTFEDDFPAEASPDNEPGFDTPSAICLSADGLEGADALLETALEYEIPVVGFETGVPGAPSGLVVSHIATDNYAAGALAADTMFASPIFAETIRNARIATPVTIVVFGHTLGEKDVEERINGFIDRIRVKAEAANEEGVHITQGINTDAPNTGAVIVATVDSAGGSAAASAILQQAEGITGFFCAAESAAEALIAATSGGADLDRVRGKYSDVTVIGFEAGASQKNAVNNQYFYGAIAHDPYIMGYKAVETAYDVLQGDKVPETIAADCLLYTYENINSRDIAPLLYD